MKRNQAIAAYSALMGVKLNKMTEDMTDAILADTLTLASVNEQFQKVQEELRKRTIENIDQNRREEYDNIVTKMKALDAQKRAALQAVINDNFADVLKAQGSYIKAINKWLDKEIDLELEKIDRKDFIKGMKDSEQNITPADLDVIAPLFKENKAVSAEIDIEEIDSLIEE
jgi:hypothetical protein